MFANMFSWTIVVEGHFKRPRRQNYWMKYNKAHPFCCQIIIVNVCVNKFNCMALQPSETHKLILPANNRKMTHMLSADCSVYTLIDRKPPTSDTFNIHLKGIGNGFFSAC